MKLRCLGTGYDARVCRKSPEKVPRDIAGLLIDDGILLDPTDALFRFVDRYALPEVLTNIHTVLISHSHPSHFSPPVLLKLAQKKRLCVIASEAVLALLPDSETLQKIAVCPGMTLSHAGYRITVLPANHHTALPAEECLLFSVLGDKHLFYGLDSGAWETDTVRFLKTHPADVLFLDIAGTRGHLTLSDVKAADGYSALLSERGRKVAFHIPTLSPEDESDFKKELSLLGILLPYDGYLLTL